MKLIDKHYEWVEKGEMDDVGLCGSIPDGYFSILEMFKPTTEAFEILFDDNESINFWGSGLTHADSLDDRRHKYTPLRQNIVLLICAMEGELE